MIMRMHGGELKEVNMREETFTSFLGGHTRIQ